MALSDEILGGTHDSELSMIEQALHTRKRYIFRPGVKVRLHGTRNVALDGKEGVVLRVNPKRIAVGIGEKGQFGYESEYGLWILGDDHTFAPDILVNLLAHDVDTTVNQYNVPTSMLEVIA